MSKILVVGTGPLYSPEIKQFCGQSLRTWHLTKPLRDAGHAVDLVVLDTDGLSPGPASGELVSAARYETFAYVIIHSHVPETVGPVLQEILNSKPYDAIVVINVNAAAIVAGLNTRLPMWVDLMGHMMGEAQAKCFIEQSDDLLRHFWARQRAALRRGDRFSVSGHKQMFAVIGELGTLGRLGHLTTDHPFCTLMPITADDQFLHMELQFAERRFRGPVFPDDAFAVLWTGGYNTWTDVKALAAALTLAMEQVPRMRFISTGGSIPGHDEVTYPAFIEEMRRSGFEDRCHFLGWIEGQEIPHLYAECDLGLNLDGLSYETLLGGRNRITNMMAAGVPVLTTIGTEISEIISENRLGYAVRIGKVQEYADAIVRAFKIPLERRQLASRARVYAREHFTPESSSRSLLKWAAEPTLAPDNASKIKRFPDASRLSEVVISSLEEEARFLEQGGLQEMTRLQAKLTDSESELAQLKGSRLFKMGQAVRKLGK